SASASVTSTVSPCAVAPRRRSSATAASTPCASRAPTATAQPSAARPSAIARPIPREPPVTIARLPTSPRSMRAFPGSGHQIDGVQSALQCGEELIDLLVTMRGTEQESTERILVDTLVEQPKHDVGELFVVIEH